MADGLRGRLYYVQDSRSYVGNDVLWWGRNSAGYTTNIDEAEVYTDLEIGTFRDTDIPWPFDYINRIARRAVDHQKLERRMSPALNKLDNKTVKLNKADTKKRQR